MNKPIVLVVIAAVAGLVWGWLEYDAGAGTPVPGPRLPAVRPPVGDDPVPAPRPAPPVSPTPGPNDPVRPPVPVRPPPADDAAVADLRAALDLYQKAKYHEADALFTKVLAGPSAGELQRQAEPSATRCRTFLAVLQELPPGQGLDYSDLSLVVLQSGSRIEARVIRETPDEVTLRKPNGAEALVPRSRIREITALSAAEVQARLEAEYAALVQRNAPPTALGHFDAAAFCWQAGLPGHVTAELERALDLDPDLPRAISEEMAKRLYQAFLWFDARGSRDEAKKALDQLVTRYGSSSLAVTARHDAAEIEKERAVVQAPPPRHHDPEPGPDPGPGGGNGKTDPPDPGPGPDETGPGASGDGPKPAGLSPEAAAALARANKLYDEGMQHFDASAPGSPHPREENQLAYQAFNKALQAYEEAYALAPGENDIARRMDEARIMKVKTFRRQKGF